jgi:hypothetical protein
LEAKEIAVISPYRGQIRKIREMMQKKFSLRHHLKWKDVTVGSTEELQVQFCFFMNQRTASFTSTVHFTMVRKYKSIMNNEFMILIKKRLFVVSNKWNFLAGPRTQGGDHFNRPIPSGDARHRLQVQFGIPEKPKKVKSCMSYWLIATRFLLFST